MQRKNELLKKIVNHYYVINNASRVHEDTSEMQHEIFTSQKKLIADTKKLLEEYRATPSTGTDNSPANEAHTLPTGWWHYHDRRVLKKCRKVLDAEIQHMLALRMQTAPDSSEMDLAFIRESFERFNRELIDSKIDDSIDTAKTNFLQGGTYLTIGGIFAVLAITLSNPIGFAIMAGAFGLIGAGITGYGLYRSNQILKEYQSAMSSIAKALETFATSSVTFEEFLQQAEKRHANLPNITQRYLQQELQQEAPKAVPEKKSQHKKHRHHHHTTLPSVSSQSVFVSKKKACAEKPAEAAKLTASLTH